jgi:hypothetical protein
MNLASWVLVGGAASELRSAIAIAAVTTLSVTALLQRRAEETPGAP